LFIVGYSNPSVLSCVVSCSTGLRHLPSFPTRRSSDLFLINHQRLTLLYFSSPNLPLHIIVFLTYKQTSENRLDSLICGEWPECSNQKISFNGVLNCSMYCSASSNGA